MPAPLYEVQILCDNCGRLVTSERVDAATFAALVEKEDVPFSVEDDDERAQGEEDDLSSEEEERPVEVFRRHVPVCGHCEPAL
jgi:hypothetical protein